LRQVTIDDVETVDEAYFESDEWRKRGIDRTAITLLTLCGVVKTIGDEAFKNCEGLTSLTLDASVETIGMGAFYRCMGIASLVIPNSVKTIGDRAFSGCKGLTSLTLPNRVYTIGKCAFSYCEGLTSLVIPDSVMTIGNHAFSGCKGLTSLTLLPDSVKTIGMGAFAGCGITSLVIPASVGMIDNLAFTSLTSVAVSAGCGVVPGAFPPGCKVTIATSGALDAAASATAATAPVAAGPAEASGAVSSAPAPAASQTSSVTTGGSGASDASAPLALERETDTLLDIYWPAMDKTYRGVVVKPLEKDGVNGVFVRYKFGERWHDFGPHDQNCTFKVIEPPIQALEWIRRTANGFQGKLPHPQHGTIWDLIPANVKNHFHDPEANEGAWLDALTIADGFQRLPSGKKKKKVTAPAKKPDCVPGGLELGFAAAGDAEASAIVAEHEDAIIAAEGRKGDRIKYAAIDVVKPLCHYDARSIKVHPVSHPSRMMPHSTLAPHRPHPPRLRLCLGRPEGSGADVGHPSPALAIFQ
jgi:hypothetical protein